MPSAQQDKARLRQWAKNQRARLDQRDRLSARICQRLADLPAYRDAQTVLWYVGIGDEVSTRELLARTLQQGNRTIAVPYCTRDSSGNRCLGLWRLDAMTELSVTDWGLLEPPQQRWQEADKNMTAQDLDAVIVPGLAFDRQGGRLGYGAGFFDRLLARLRADSVTIGLSFEAQIVEHVIMEAHDVGLDWLVTETAVYRGRGRS